MRSYALSFDYARFARYALSFDYARCARYAQDDKRLLGVGGVAGERLMQKERLRVFRGDRFELSRFHREVEGIADARRMRVVSAERSEVPVLLDEVKDAAELIDGVLDVRLDVRRDDQHRYAEARTALPVARPWRSDVIVQAAPIIPDDDHRGRIPIAALADCIDDRCDPRWSGIGAVAGMVGVGRVRRYPGDAGELVFRNVGKDVVGRSRDVRLPFRTIANRMDRIEGAPNPRRISALGIALFVFENFHRVEFPGDRLCVEEIAHGRVAEARKRAAVGMDRSVGR